MEGVQMTENNSLGEYYRLTFMLLPAGFYGLLLVCSSIAMCLPGLSEYVFMILIAGLVFPVGYIPGVAVNKKIPFLNFYLPSLSYPLICVLAFLLALSMLNPDKFPFTMQSLLSSLIFAVVCSVISSGIYFAVRHFKVKTGTDDGH